MSATAAVRATDSGNASLSTEKNIKNFISTLYSQICFEKDTLSFEPFEAGVRGYLNLHNEGKLNASRQIITICDFSRSANDNRLWIIDLKDRKVLFHTYVAHGQGSGEEFANAFSNKMNSHQSSLGFYVTTETYQGEHGLSLRLNGMDKGYNSAALERDIVVHGAPYVSTDFIKGNERLGRSWGCPAVPENLSSAIINTIKDSTCLFIYYPQQKYLNASVWLNKRVMRIPDALSEPFLAMVAANSQAKKKPVRKVEYVSADSLRASGRYYQVIDKHSVR